VTTRCYLPFQTSPTVSPSVTGGGVWASTASAVLRQLGLQHMGSGLNTGTSINVGTTGTKTALDRYYVSPPLAGAQTLSGTVQLYTRAIAAAGGPIRSYAEIFVVSNDGSTVRGTLLSAAQYVATNISSVQQISKAWFNGNSMSSVNANDLDRIVIGIGYQNTASSGTVGASAAYGDFNTSTHTDIADGPANESNTTNVTGWIEFSGTIKFHQSTVKLVEQAPNGSSTNTSFSTGSHTPTANTSQLIIVMNEATSGTTTNTPTITASPSGLSVSQIATVQCGASGGTQLAITAFIATGTASGAGVFTASFAGQAQATNSHISWWELGGCNSSSPIRQSKTGTSGTAAATSLTITPNSSVLADNACFAFFGVNGSAQSTPRSGWGEQYSIATGSFSKMYQFRPNGESTSSNTNGVNTQVAGITLELAEGLPSQTISPTGIASAETFGSPKLTQYVGPNGIASAAAFGTPVLGLHIAAAGIASGEAFGTPRVVKLVDPTGIASAEAFGTPTLALELHAAGIPSAEAFGTPRMIEFVAPVGIPSAEAFGTPRLTLELVASGIPSAEAFGIPSLTQRLTAAGIASAEAFGVPTLRQTIYPHGIPSAEAFGEPGVDDGSGVIRPRGIASVEAFGTPRLALELYARGIASAEAFGRPRLVRLIDPIGIPSEEGFGVPILSPYAVYRPMLGVVVAIGPIAELTPIGSDARIIAAGLTGDLRGI